VVVTEFALANWLAQTFKLDLAAMPGSKPGYISLQAYDDLRHLIRDQMMFEGGTPKTPEMEIVAQLMKLVK
jgi:hypothetical protein